MSFCLSEWAPHACCWLAWPKLEDEWPNGLEAVREEVAALIVAIASGEKVRLLVSADEPLPNKVEQAVERVDLPYGDIWTRDSVPIRLANGEIVTHTFNGWGNKYLFEGDDVLVRNIADRAGGPTRNVDLVLEGGGLEFDGTGRCLVTRSSLLNDNRNPEVSEELATQRLCAAYGVRDVHWLDGTLTNDHTDGHIDTLARFIAPGEVVCVAPDPHKPNHAALASIYDGLSQLCAQGALKAVHTVPAPEPVLASDGTPLPASHMNFYIANHAVIVPAYGIASDAVVHEKLRSIIADRPVVLSPARQILEGGGALHCITRDWPRLP